MGEKKFHPIPGDDSGMVVMTTLNKEQLISALREAFPALAAANAQAAEAREILTEEEVAEILDVEPRTVRNYVKTQGLPAKELGKSRGKRYRRSEVMAWLDARASTPGAHVDRHVTRLKGAKR